MVESKWDLVRTDTFLSLYHSKNEILKKRIRRVIEDLAQADNPLWLGEKKENLGFWTTDVSRSDRLAYTIDGNRLLLLKICDHKEVYGKG